MALIVQYVNEPLTWISDTFVPLLAPWKKALMVHVYNNGGDSEMLQRNLQAIVEKSQQLGVTVDARVVV